jgi:HSP20 family protein
MNDLDVQVIHGELSIRGHRLAVAPEGVTMHKQERLEGAFARSVSLPCEVDTERVEAVLKDGVLVVTLPKSETVKPRKITVREE